MKYRVTIEAEIKARNFPSAQKKLADLQAAVAKKAHASEVRMKGEK